jgi:ComF family protein
VNLHWLFPPRCLSCRSFLRNRQGLCEACESRWPHISESCCPRCARPFENVTAGSHLCGDCLLGDFSCEKVQAVGRYVGLLHDLIVRLKYRGEERLGRFLGDKMAQNGVGSLGSWDLVLPIPLHRKRLRERGYNQSFLLARRLARKAQLPVDAFLLKKTRETEVQAGLTREERLKNLKGCFEVTRPEVIRGKRILLVDDVFTTGSTLETAAQALSRAGADCVEALVLARAV